MSLLCGCLSKKKKREIKLKKVEKNELNMNKINSENIKIPNEEKQITTLNKEKDNEKNIDSNAEIIEKMQDYEKFKNLIEIITNFKLEDIKV